jgi:hypothetical protein
MNNLALSITNNQNTSVFDKISDGTCTLTMDPSNSLFIFKSTNHENQVIIDIPNQSITGAVLEDEDFQELVSHANTDLHFHDSDRDRSNHQGTQLSSTISDISTTIGNNSDVSSALSHSQDNTIHLSSTQKTGLTDNQSTILHTHDASNISGINTYVTNLIDTEVELPNQDLNTTDSPSFVSVSTQTINVIDSSPELVLENTTHEDTDGGRESIIRFRGQQSGGEDSTLAIIKASHSGSSDDQKGQLSIFVNNADNGDDEGMEALKVDINGSIQLGNYSNPVNDTSGSLKTHGGISCEQTMWVGSNLHVDGNIYGGYLGYQTRIKLLFCMFQTDNDSLGSNVHIYDDQAVPRPEALRVNNASTELYASCDIPNGYKVTGYCVYTNNTREIRLYKQYITNSNAVQIHQGVSNVPYENSTHITGSTTIYAQVYVAVTSTSDSVYGGYLTIEKS